MVKRVNVFYAVRALHAKRLHGKQSEEDSYCQISTVPHNDGAKSPSSPLTAAAPRRRLPACFVRFGVRFFAIIGK